jgi:CubicO group peptidase (beta-lactamase class C family)
LESRVSKEHAMEDCDRMTMVTTYNRPEVHLAVQPAGGGIATARDLSRFYAMMVGGGTLDSTRVLKQETVEEVTKLQVEGMDHTLERPVRRSLGLSLADGRMGSPDKMDDRTFGHAGAGTSVGWADPELGLAVGFITNGFRAEHSNTPRLSAISQAVRDACL